MVTFLHHSAVFSLQHGKDDLYEQEKHGDDCHSHEQPTERVECLNGMHTRYDSIIGLYSRVWYFYLVYAYAEDEPEDDIDNADAKAFPDDGDKQEEYGDDK